MKSLFTLMLLAGAGGAMLLSASDATPEILKAPQPGTITTQNGTLLVGTGRGTVAVSPVSPDIFRVTNIPAGERQLTIPASQSAVLKPSTDGVSTFATPSEVIIESPTTILRIDRASGRIVFENAAGDTLLSETAGIDNASAKKSISLRGSGGNYYGAGERGHSMRLNGDTLVMYNRQNYGYTGTDPRISQMGVTMPYFANDRGYGVLFDDYNRASMFLGDTILYESQTPKPLSYYFINGSGSLAGVAANYAELTGRQDLPPFWALGYITSKYGYHNEKEALGAVDSLKTRGYPVDGIVFDLYWYGKETDMGRLEWNKDQFPDHRRMLDSLNNMGVHTILISQPYINKIGAIDNYNVLNSKGMLTKNASGNTNDVTTWVGEAGMFDVSNPDTREWLWNRLRPLTAEGLAGWWGDLGEPEVHPLTIVHNNGETAEQYHNVYGNRWSELIYNGLRKDFPDMRPMLLMRGGTAGLQRYSVFPWTTDVSRSWGGLEPQINLMLSSGLSGLGYMSSDIGGFAVDPAHPYDPELYVRWLEMGAFTPVFRTHAQQKPEPYHYPAQEKIIKKYIKMRYEWLPYNYTLAYENAAKGLPLARPLNFRPENKKLNDVEDEYLWGDNVLVAPVMKAGARSRKVVFPAGEWYSWWNPRLRYSGVRPATVKAPLDMLPLFVKAGSFIPQFVEEIENTSEYDPQLLTVRYYPSKEKSGYVLFDDNRKSPVSLEKNDFQLTTFSADPTAGSLKLGISSKGSYEGMPDGRMITFEIMAAKRPASVSCSIDAQGDRHAQTFKLDSAVSPRAIRQYGWHYDAATSVLTVRLPYDYRNTSLTIR